MRVKIIPAVLAGTAQQFDRRLALALELSRELHIDVMDGRFVKTRSVSQTFLRSKKLPTRTEWHCMVVQPENWLPLLLPGAKQRIIIPVELQPKLPVLLALFRSRKIPVSLAINPDTPIGKLTPWLSRVSECTVMGVRPGAYGGRFWPGTVERVRQLHVRYPRCTITADGGVTPQTAPRLVAAGASRLVVGSFLLRSRDPAQALRQLQNAVSKVR